jgi:hypothetical protein
VQFKAVCACCGALFIPPLLNASIQLLRRRMTPVHVQNALTRVAYFRPSPPQHKILQEMESNVMVRDVINDGTY